MCTQAVCRCEYANRGTAEELYFILCVKNLLTFRPFSDIPLHLWLDTRFNSCQGSRQQERLLTWSYGFVVRSFVVTAMHSSYFRLLNRDCANHRGSTPAGGLTTMFGIATAAAIAPTGVGPPLAIFSWGG